MGKACSTYEEKRDANRVSVRMQDGKRETTRKTQT
jgi:hypothetical protein